MPQISLWLVQGARDSVGTMDLTEEDISEYVTLWKEEFGEDISRADARHSASQFLELYSLLSRPLPVTQPAPGTIKPDLTRPT